MATGLASEAHIQAVVDTAADGVILIDAAGRVLMFNPACEKLFGYQADDVVGRNVKLLMPAPYRGEHDKYLQNYLRTGEAKIIGIGREVTGQRKDGSTFPMDLSVGESREGDGPIFVGIIRDLTARNQAEREVRESEARLRAVVSTAVDGVILIDALGNVQMFNPACERLLGYTADEVIGRNVKMLMPDEYASEHDQYLENYRHTGEAKIIGIGREVVARRKDGTTLPIDLSVGEARQHGDSIFVGILHDLTERKKTEKQLVQAQKMEAVGHLAGGIAHDFNNLLTVIIGGAESLQAALKPRPDLESVAESIFAAGERGAELTQRLLAFSRRQMLQPMAVNCHQLLDHMERLLRRMLREDIHIEMQVEEDLWTAFADPAQLESALLNLAINAQDAMPEGGSLSISAGNIQLDEAYKESQLEVLPGDYIIIGVTDSGEGMSPEVRAHVFEPFFTTKEVGKGSGLGLSMVYGFVKQSGGHITLYSEPGLGTTVRLYVPAGPTHARDHTEVSPRRRSALPSGTEKILVVEDDVFVRAHATLSLGSLGYRVVAAEDALAALQLLDENPDIDLVFTDLVMPGGMSGWQLAEAIWKDRPDMKVLFTSGYAQESVVRYNQIDTPIPFINKPFRKVQLAKQIRDILDAHS
ncbi:MAG TPA: PAS domain S-box protein [Gammaproteobacteria bacterium]|nr:PAS domain S-box protein [Gammaproteobacteria bacterium]